MKRCTDRILTTHVGSLARPDALVPILKARDRGQPYDRDTYAKLVRDAVAEAVRRQTAAGVDVVTDGEQGKASFFGYIVERFNGFARKPAPPGREGNPRDTSREYRAFADYYAWSERIAEWAGGRGGDRRHGVDVCTGPVSYKGHAAVRTDIDNLRNALKGLPHEEVFMPAIAPSYIFATLANEFYRTEEEYEQALADALREEYRAIVDAGFVLQVDDPRLITQYMMNPDPSVADCRKWAAKRVEAINYSLRGIPPEKVRFHTCYSIDVGPRVYDMELKVIAGADCGFAASGVRFNDIHPSVAWLKFAAMAEGACLATRQLWGRA